MRRKAAGHSCSGLPLGAKRFDFYDAGVVLGLGKEGRPEEGGFEKIMGQSIL
jgi:hypothetical protein